MHTSNAPYFKHIPLADGLSIFRFHAMTPQSFAALVAYHQETYNISHPVFMLIDMGSSLIFPFMNLTMCIQQWQDTGFIPTTTRHAYIHAPNFPQWAGFHYNRLHNADLQARFFLHNQHNAAVGWLQAEREAWLSSPHHTTPAGSLS